MNIYKTILDSFKVKEGDRIWLSSELARITIQLRRENIEFTTEGLIDAFQERLGNTGTLIIPNFSFEFSNHGFYDIRNTRGVTGALGNIAMHRNDFKRTHHPMHSFEIWGQDQQLLTDLRNLHSFGVDSPFAYCLSHHVKQLILGTDYVHAMTFVHYAETVCNVPYRFAKNFSGIYVNSEGKKEHYTCEYAARKLEIKPVERFNRIGKILEDRGISKKVDILGTESYVIDLAMSFPVICQDITENNCRNIYDFNVDRESIFTYSAPLKEV